MAELERRLAADHGRTDADVAQELSALQLTERMSTATLARLQTNSPGPKTTQELEILADQSSFLALPASEIPATPAPDAAMQRQIMGLVVNYVTKTTHELPNFMATRATRSFEDRPEGLYSYLPLRPVSQSTASVTYRDGKEEDTNGATGKKVVAGSDWLVSWGEFGPILSTVLLDSAQSQLGWGHWEQGLAGAVAVFRYAVSAKKSHYRVQFNNRFGYETHEFAAYHGEMAVDPATGAILRLTLVGDLGPDTNQSLGIDPEGGDQSLLSASIMVRYGEVQIGGKKYICPTRSVALAQRHVFSQQLYTSGPGMSHTPIITRLNEVDFKDYHLFRGDTRIVSPEEAAKMDQEQAAAPAENASVAETAKAPVPAQESEQAENQAAPAGTASPTVAAQQPAEASTPATGTTQTAETTQTRATTIDDSPLFKTTARDVVVDVVVTKGNGEPVPELSKQDFEVSENGKPQTIDFFEEHTGNASPAGPPPEMPVLPVGMRTNVPEAPPGDAVNVLLIDTLNTGLQDQAFVRKAVLQFLAKMQPGTRMAIFALGSKLRCIQGFRTDNSALLAALNDKKTGLNAQKSDLLKTASDRADDANDVAALESMRASGFAIEALQQAVADTGARDFAERASMTFQALMYLGHSLAGLPGRKNLIWFAGSFPMTIFPTAEQLAHLKQNPNLPGYVDRVKATADLFTVSQIAVYPISAEGLMTDNVGGADMAGPGGSDMGHMGSRPGYDPDNPGNSTMSPYNAGAGERANTTYAMNQLAASTGGKAFYNTNDLDKALQRALEDGANYYTVGYSPTDAKLDGSYRQIEMKMAHGRYNLAYQRGYNADPGPAAQGTSSFDPLTSLLQPRLPDATGVFYGVHAEVATSETSSAAPMAGQNAKLQGPLTRYIVSFVIRGQDILETPNAQGGRSGKFLLGLKAYDRAGNALNSAGDQESVDVTPDQYASVRKNGIPARVEIDVPASGDVQLVTAVFNLNSGEAGTVAILLHPASRVPGEQSSPGVTRHP